MEKRLFSVSLVPRQSNDMMPTQIWVLAYTFIQALDRVHEAYENSHEVVSITISDYAMPGPPRVDGPKDLL